MCNEAEHVFQRGKKKEIYSVNIETERTEGRLDPKKKMVMMKGL